MLFMKRYVSDRFVEAKLLWDKAPGFWDEVRCKGVTEALTRTEVSILRHGVDSIHPRPEAARFSYVAASPGFEGVSKMGDGSA